MKQTLHWSASVVNGSFQKGASKDDVERRMSKDSRYACNTEIGYKEDHNFHLETVSAIEVGCNVVMPL